MQITALSIDNFIDIPVRNNVGESPFWHPDNKTWHWLDQAGSIYSYDPAKHVYTKQETTQRLGCMVLGESGESIITGINSAFTFNQEQSPIATIQHAYPDLKFADGRCDRQGRLVVSTMHLNIHERQPWGNWFVLTHDQDFQFKKISDVNCIIPNGSAFSPKGDTFYFSETDTKNRRIFKCHYDIDDVVITKIELFVDLSSMNLGRPDGAAIDTDGCYWICGLDDGVILRITPQGNIDQVFKTPMKKPTMCSFGGDDYKTMFVTSLCRGEEDLIDDPHGGKTMLLNLGYQGIPEARCRYL